MPHYSSQPADRFPKAYLGPTLMALMLIIGIFIGYRLGESEPIDLMHGDEIISDSSGRPVHGRLEQVLRYIDSRYIDEYSMEELEEHAIESLLKDLDPHSSFIHREDLAAINEQLDGSFVGIGIEFAILNDTVIVLSAIQGGPAAEAGLQSGDRIVSRDGLPLEAGLSLNELITHFKGEEGSTLTLGILRGSEREVRSVKVVRDEVPIVSVPAAFMLNDETAYIRISRFSATTFQEFIDQLERLSENGGFQNLVMDLRHNPGGFLDQATKILNQFFSEADKLLVYMEGDHSRRSEHKSTGRDFFNIGNIVVLIDEESASASEIVAGAIQDLDRGILIGRPSFGKGLVQEQYDLRDGSALRLTVAKYYTPSGRCIQKPYGQGHLDEAHPNTGAESKRESLASTSTSPHLANNHPDTLRAYTTSNGRTVYGGGGIQPDIELPADSADFHPAIQFARLHALKFAATHGAELLETTPTTLAYLLSNYQLPSHTTDLFAEFATRYAADINSPQTVSDTDLQALQSPALRTAFEKAILTGLAHARFGEGASYEILVHNDSFVEAALEALPQPNRKQH